MALAYGKAVSLGPAGGNNPPECENVPGVLEKTESARPRAYGIRSTFYCVAWNSRWAARPLASYVLLTNRREAVLDLLLRHVSRGPRRLAAARLLPRVAIEAELVVGDLAGHVLAEEDAQLAI